MKLIECTIRAFGRFRDEHIVFEDGLHVLHRPNGWGKTTLTAFIKAMLYGLSDSRKRDLLDNERQRFLPWDGAVAGGALVFEVRGRRYRVERTFHKKSTGGDDTVTVYDLQTGAPCPPSDTPLGESLFGIDAEAFERTVFLSERRLSGKTDNRTIAAKLADLVGTDGDIGALDRTLAAIDEKRKEYHKLRGGGEIDRLNEQLRDAYRQKSADEAALAAVTEQLSIDASLAERESGVRRELDELREAWKSTPGPEAERLLTEQYGEEKARLDQAEAFCLRLRESLGAATLPSRADIRRAEDAYRRCEELRRRLQHADAASEQLQAFFRRPTDEDELHRVRESLSRPVPSKLPAPLLWALSLVGIPLGLLVHPLLWLLLPTLALLGVALRHRYVQAKKAREEAVAFVRSYPTVSKNVHMAFEEILQQFTNLSLQNKQQTDKGRGDTALLSELEENERILSEFSNSAVPIEGTHTFSRLYGVLESLEREEHARAEAGRRLCDLEEQIRRQHALYTAGGREALEAEMKRGQDELEQLLARRKELALLRRDADELSERIEQTEHSIEQMSERRAVCEEELDVLLRTADYLKRAAERLSERYKKKTQAALDRYISLLHPNAPSGYQLSTTFELRCDEGGTYQPIDAYSHGTRDLYYFALRLALVDALFEKEVPFLVLDDPFTHLDDARLREAKALVAALSRERQILYFTCAEERAPQPASPAV